MTRILIIGCAGAGKSTLAKELRDIYNLEVIHLDKYFWKPGWVASKDEEWNSTIQMLLNKDEWIIDGNYSAVLEAGHSIADRIIYLDLSRYVCLFRMLRRVITGYGKTRDDLTEGCPEKLDWEFIKWIWNYPNRSRKKTIKILEDAKECTQVIILKTRRDVTKFVLSERTSAKKRA